MSSFEFLVHDSFKERFIEFTSEHLDHSEALQTQLRRSVAEPTSGSLIRDLPEHLSGKLYKRWISGGTGFRYIYFHDPGHKVVIPVFLSLTPKIDKDDAWDVAEVASLASQIVDDFVNDRIKRFTRMEVV